jgi:threonine/homoserine/homoserine lactone efflux protein
VPCLPAGRQGGKKAVAVAVLNPKYFLVFLMFLVPCLPAGRQGGKKAVAVAVLNPKYFLVFLMFLVFLVV